MRCRGDDDTYWALGRIDETFTLLRRAVGEGTGQLRLYAGAMQYHSWWDFAHMEPQARVTPATSM